MRILLTNDDGIEAPGFRELAVAILELGHDLVVAAPARQLSGASASILIDNDSPQVEVRPHDLGIDGLEARAVGAAPAMCVLLAIHGRFGARPELVVSGPNHGANAGRVVLHSGTVGAALTAGANGIRGLAVSLDVGLVPTGYHWNAAARTAAGLLELAAAQPAGAVLNLNVPNRAEPAELVEAPLDPAGIVHTTTTEDDDEDSVRLALASATGRSVADSDADLLARGFATLTRLAPVSALPLEPPLPHP
ncbi:5'/3'-nucleotidase SurE [Homoserinibacter sp. YIM 151385]|uniref:5'/3'-nucleotidase SurE n=1 Tax=Homoserinibacter sp. YIM 151385 TaxID=2985506 RepID=UPI0022F0D923|nr:5'/3'-nucleotidase SurE [Homoserinibacter sp. YIM 151385]WBU37879.1 5'/3'-nucleotidase SurE [Homoserinibacter sp. YIM 151385]